MVSQSLFKIKPNDCLNLFRMTSWNDTISYDLTKTTIIKDSGLIKTKWNSLVNNNNFNLDHKTGVINWSLVTGKTQFLRAMSLSHSLKTDVNANIIVSIEIIKICYIFHTLWSY